MASPGSQLPGFSDLHIHISRLKQALSCSICHCLMQKAACLQCHHHFCMSCLLQAMKEISACPKCKQPATTRQAKLSPEIDNLVDICQNLEAVIGHRSHDASHGGRVKDEKNMAFTVKVEDACFYPTEMNSELISDATGFGDRKRSSSVDIPCRGILPASKRIQLPCPPLVTEDAHKDPMVSCSSVGGLSKDSDAAVLNSISSPAKAEVHFKEQSILKSDRKLNKKQNASSEDINGIASDSLMPSSESEDADKITCAFCHKTEDDAKVAGSMIWYKKGIFVNYGHKRTGHIYGVHRNCAEWAPGVYYDDDVAKNIPQEVVRGHKIKCHICGLRGAVLGCYVKRCRKSFHYPCAQTVSCRWDDSNFLVLCPEHVNSRFPGEGAKELKSLPKSVRGSGEAQTSSDVSAPEETYFHNGEYKPEANFSFMERPIPKRVKNENTTTEDHSRSWTTVKLVLCGSGLSPKANELLSTFVHRTGAVMQKTWTNSVTHLITGTDGMGAARRTFKYLMANLQGKWILKVDWLSACIAAGRLVSEEPYEISLDIHGMIGGPRHARSMAVCKTRRLFEGLKFYFLGDYAAAYKADLQTIIMAAGGVILPIIPELQDGLSEQSHVVIYNKDVFFDTSFSHREEMIKARYFEAKSIAQAAGAEVAGHTWILDSVAAYELQPFE